jgi:solute:Na+ symporter, SSS family
MDFSSAASHFSWAVDGSIVGLYLLATMVAGVMVRRYVGKVEDFLVAGREMNVYLGIASLAATEFGIITCMYTAQAGYVNGFSGAIPGICQCVAMLVIGITGFCIKPLRESGVITIPELFDRKFGSKARWLAGVVIVLGGLLNMGVFLKIGGDFLVMVTNIGVGKVNLGFIELTNLQFIMALLLIAVAVYTIMGGMLSVLITDFLQFIVMSVGLIAVTILIFKNVGFHNIVETVQTNVGPGGFNPVRNPALGWPFLIFQILIQTAATLTWQTCIARVLAAKDQKTGRKVYTGTAFFFVARFLIPGMWGMAALWMLTQPVNRPHLLDLRRQEMTAMEMSGNDAAKALSPEQRAQVVERSKELKAELGAKKAGELTAGDKNLLAVASKVEQDVSLHAMPKFLSLFVPIGLMGLLLAAMLAADMSTDSSYMLTWGSVIYNDITAPFRKTKWPEKKGILVNRMIVALIGVYLMIFGLFYEIKGNVWDYLTLTGSIYLSSMSVLLIACCYWKKANSWGAFGGIIMGGSIPVLYLTMQKVPALAPVADKIGPYYSGIAAYAGAALGMIVGSLLKPAGSSPSTQTQAEGRS